MKAKTQHALSQPAARALASTVRAAHPTAKRGAALAVAASSTFECLACHEKGALIAGKRAPMMSHERHDSCTQCHVAAGGPPTPPPPPISSSSFVGEQPSFPGDRAWPGAPPTIPHTTVMIENWRTTL